MNQAAIVHPKVSERNFTRAIQPLLSEPERYAKLGIKLVNFAYPYLDLELSWYRHGTGILLRVDGTDYSYRPVGGWWIDPEGQPLRQGISPTPCGCGFHQTMQDGEPRSWFCFLGWREYHDHVSHQDVSWASLRRDRWHGVLNLVLALHEALNKPEVLRQ